VEVFDLQSALLHFYSAVLSSVDLSQGSLSDSVQCHLIPLVPAIQDSATLYDIIFKLMKALHSSELYCCCCCYCLGDFLFTIFGGVVNHVGALLAVEWCGELYGVVMV